MKIEVENIPNRWLVAIMGTILQVALGTVYAWSFFQQPVMAANNWSNSEAAWTFSLAIFCLGLAAAWGGINLPRFGPRKLAMTGGFLFSVGYLIAAYALSIKNLPLLYMGYGVIGGIGLGLGYVTPVATAAKWFPDKKGFITGMVVMGFGFGALIMAKVLAPLFMSITDGNLVLVFSYVGLIMFIITLPAGYYLVNPPVGFVPKGYTPLVISAVDQTKEDSITGKQCIRSRQFLMMWTVFFFNIIAGIMFISFQSPMLQDLLKKNMDPATLTDPAVIAGLAVSGGTLIAITSIFNGIGRFLWGGLSDKIGRVQTFRLILGSQLVVLIAIMFVDNPIVFGACLCYILLCYGGGFGSMPSFVLDVFGPKLMPVVYGSILTAWGCGGIVGSQIVAFFKDHFAKQASQYTFLSAAVLLLLGLMITFALSNKRFVLREARANNEEFKIYAAYGSNMHLEEMKNRCPQAKMIGKGELLGYKLTFRGNGEGFANIEVCDYESVPIVLWAITQECEGALDNYEDYPVLYKKEIATITTVGGEKRAMLYVMVTKYEEMPTMPSEEYFEILRQGYKDNAINVAPLLKALEITKNEIANQ